MKHFFKIFGVLSFSVILSSIFVTFGNAIQSSFVADFIDNQIITIATTLFGFNIASQTILLGQLQNIEVSMKKLGHFKNTRNELQANAITNLVIICLIFVLVATLQSTNPLFQGNNIVLVLQIALISCLSLIMHLLFETVVAIYRT